jgi:hypothetical protein
MIRKITLALLVLFVLIQFIRPTKNVSAQLITDNDISTVYPISEEVHQILIQKCYDCHSNHTNYPWYFNIQPVAWWLAGHINEGKKELNFSEFKTYPEKKAIHKLEEMGEVADENSMPLQSYVIMHPHSKLSDHDRAAIKTWLKSLPVTFEHH